MAEYGEPQVPCGPQCHGELPGENQEPDSESVEIRLEFEQRLPGGFIRFSWRSIRNTNRPQSPQQSKPSRRNIAILVIFFTLIIIGLIAVGPEGVWRETKELLPNLFN